jgi:protein-S-isoprenylcysteine O-methyltransferase Ste14
MAGISALTGKVALYFAGALVAAGLMLFLPAGTLDYWQAWLFLAVLFVPVSLVAVYFLKNDPGFLERRLMLKEKERQQKAIILAGQAVLLVAILVPGLDRRFGWSFVPPELVLFADLVFLFGYCLTFRVFQQNAFAGRTVEIFKGQKLVSTGLYAVVRHPMYFAQLLIYLSLPIALGSYWAFPLFLAMPAILAYRLLDEERVLLAGLPGYKAYCKRTPYRLIPFVW